MQRYSYIPCLLIALGCNVEQPALEEQNLGSLQSALSTGSAQARGQHQRDATHRRNGRRHHRRPPPRCEAEADAGAPIGEDVAESCCGGPGDTGNELGVGEFCTRDEHCAGNAGATLCSSIENEITDHKSFFCTIPCDPNQPENICGEGAICNCEEVGCACTPTSCIENPRSGCEEP